MITAPYNFVPLSDKVYYPDEDEIINHDVPFEDGVTGTIEFSLRSETPIFVRNGHKRSCRPSQESPKGTKEYQSFSKSSDGKYFIPATSMKGMIRSVLESMSFCKMNFTQDHSFSIRDLQNKSYTSLMKKTSCGWLEMTAEGYHIIDCGVPRVVPIDEIDKKLNCHVLETFIKEGDFTNDANKTARKKYEIIYSILHPQKTVEGKDEFAQFIESNDYLLPAPQDGTYVLTGQSSQRRYDPDKKKPIPAKGEPKGKKGCWTGKGKEFIFPAPHPEEKPLPVSPELFYEFEDIHRNSEDYINFWRLKLKKGDKIPVFFLKDGQQILHIGLTRLFRLPARRSVFSAIRQETKQNAERHIPDMAERIFGFSIDKESLKGRVQFSHAFANGTVHELSLQSFVMGTPHASYYPLYVEDGKDWNNAVHISGRKRYPVRSTFNNYSSGDGTDKMKQYAILLDKHSTFKCQIVFFNLHPYELGALLSSLTFHGNEKECYHNIGMGKPLGLGKVKLTNLSVKVDNKEYDHYHAMAEYEQRMQQFLDGDNWLETPQVKELLLMARGIPKGAEDNFRYMIMNPKGANEFKDNKGAALPNFSQIIKENDFIAESMIGRHLEIVETPAFIPSTHAMNDIVECECHENKKVTIDGQTVQMVVPRGIDSKALIGKRIKVKVAQISKVGKLVQVCYIP